ncbi:hypothetical protein SLEP1_g50799 [Rubroshorea leprosula]|uniref:TMhelix containing protein n=1 Tax=Rubroshorea leprosula TaxID=152421 RepID=A0AAV5M232_9ROSI|nr:hypothetical protein SLEP1_g50799 [Rubroshorea leprosula]
MTYSHRFLDYPVSISVGVLICFVPLFNRRKNGFAAVEWIMSFFAWGVAENYVAYLFVSREKE